MDDKDKKIFSLKNVLHKLKTKVTKQEETLRLMKLQKLNETRKKWRNFKTFEMHINKRKYQTSPQENESTKSLVGRLTLCEALNEEVFSEEQIKHLSGKCLFQATVTSLALNYHLSYMVDELQDDKIKRVDSIKVTFVNPFHHSELDKWISQCYRNNDLKCIVQGISKYSQLYTLRDAVIEKVMSLYGQFFTFILSEENHCCLVKCENLQWGLKYFVGNWKIEGSTCSDSMKHNFIFELQQRALRHTIRSGCLPHLLISSQTNLWFGLISACLILGFQLIYTWLFYLIYTYIDKDG